jgi:hypothetical protein
MEDSTPDAERRTATDQSGDTSSDDTAQATTTFDQLTEVEPVRVNRSALDLSERELTATLRSHARTASLTTEEVAQAIERGRLDGETLASARTEVRELASLLDDLSE